MALRLQSVPAAKGMQWVRDGFREFFKQPLGYIGLFASVMFAMTIAQLIPIIGGLVVGLATPLLTLAFLMAVEGSVKRGEAIHPSLLIAPWRAPVGVRRRWLGSLCAIYVVSGIVLTLWPYNIIIDAANAASSVITAPTAGSAGGVPTAEAMRQMVQAMQRFWATPWVPQAMLALALIVSLISVPFWFAPGLVYWAAQRPMQALFSSTVALWRARAAFLVYSLAWAALGCAAVLALTVVAGIGGQFMGVLLMIPMLLTGTLAFLISLYFSFVDCFGEPE